MLVRNASICAFTLVLLHSAIASAQSEEDGWFSEKPETEAAPAEQQEQAQAAEPESAPAKAASKAEASAAAKARIDVTADPVRDEPAPKKRRSAGAHRHDGFYLRMSLGGGSLAARGERYDDAAGATTDYSFNGNALQADIAIGGTPAPGFVIGGAYLGSYGARGGPEHGDADTGLTFGLVGPFMDFFPEPRGGFHIGGLLGAAATGSHDDQYDERSAAIGFGGAAWVGYDLWVSNQWSLGGYLRASAARVETPQNRVVDMERDRLEVGSIALLVSALYH